MLMTEAGYQFGHWWTPIKINVTQLGTIQGVIVGLLSLLLGFTYQVASARYDDRWKQVVDEANAIGTTFLRAQMLPDPHKTEVSNLLRQYVDVRIAFFEVWRDYPRIQELLQDTDRIHGQLWSHANVLGKENPQSVILGLFINTLNSLIDLHATRLAFIRARVPTIILGVLSLIGCVSMLATGYVMGLQGQHLPILTTILAVIIALVFLMIVDLDRPAQGPTKVSEQSLIDLRDSLKQYQERSN